jgi:hypothetical protein
MATWWITEALPIHWTALVPLVLFPLTGVLTVAETARPYVDPYIFLFAGGMCIGAAMQQWDLHRRIALTIMRAIGTSPRRLLLGILAATAFISQDNMTGDLYLRATLDGGMKLPRRTRGGREDAIQVSVDSTSFYPDPIESPVRENTKFMEWHRLRELLIHPEKSKRMRKQLNEFIRADQREGFLRRIEDALNSADNRFLFDTGTEQYVIERGEAPVDVRNDKLVIGSFDASTTNVTPSDRPLPRLRQLNRSEGLDATAREITIRATPTITSAKAAPADRWFAIEIELADAMVKSGNTTTPRSRFLRPFSVPMPEDLIDYQHRKVEDYRDAPRATNTRDAPLSPNNDRMMALDR